MLRLYVTTRPVPPRMGSAPTAVRNARTAAEACADIARIAESAKVARRIASVWIEPDGLGVIVTSERGTRYEWRYYPIRREEA